MANIPKNIENARKRAGLTQQELADKICVARSTINMYELGEREPKAGMIEKIADALGMTPSEITGWSSTQEAAHEECNGDEEASNFGTVLREIREERELSLQQMAELLGTSRQVLSRYENNKRTPKLSTVVEYAAKLHVPVSLLTDDSISVGFDDRPQTPRDILKGLAKAVGASLKVRSGQIVIKMPDKTYTFSNDESEHYVRECAEYLLFILSRRG